MACFNLQGRIIFVTAIDRIGRYRLPALASRFYNKTGNLINTNCLNEDFEGITRLLVKATQQNQQSLVTNVIPNGLYFWLKMNP
jgi:hypothetical protein